MNAATLLEEKAAILRTVLIETYIRLNVQKRGCDKVLKPPTVYSEMGQTLMRQPHLDFEYERITAFYIILQEAK